MIIQPETILTNAFIGVIGVDTHGMIQYCNHRAKQLLHCDIAPGFSLKEIHPGMDKQVRTCIEQGKNNQTFHFKTKEEKIETQISLLVNGTETIGAACFIQNIKQVEDSAFKLPNIKEMLLQFQALLDHSYYGIYILDHKGIVLKVNDVAAGLIGLKKEEMMGMDISDLVEKGIADTVLTPAILKYKKPMTRPLYVIKSNKYIMASGMPIFDEKGEILFVVVIEHDMTIVRELRARLEQVKQVADTIKSELSDRNLLELKSSKIIADAPAMNQVLTVLLKLAKMDASNILITGESGTGKGLLAKFVHHNGNRRNKPFISINCAALPDMLLEAELFGYEKGAFTGASESGKAGLFELASQGTIFLDEIGDLPFSVQAKLLKFLDDGEIRRLGGTRTIKVNCIVIAATNQNLEKLVQRKKFRQDLYFRLNIFPVHVPALRKRQEDILKISNFYLKKYNKIYKQKKRFSENCLEQLQTYDFPGNVRELKNIIKNAVVIKEKEVLDTILLPGISRLKSSNSSFSEPAQPVTTHGLNEELLEFERKKLEQAMARFDSTRDLANHLNISQSTVVRKLKKHGLSFD
ncbi:sigma 54-interacting transcriptional regulator [Desulfobacula sp.]